MINIYNDFNSCFSKDNNTPQEPLLQSLPISLINIVALFCDVIEQPVGLCFT